MDLASATVASLIQEIDQHITEKRPYIKGEFPDGFHLVLDNEILANVRKLARVRDYKTITLQAVQKDPTVQEEKGDQAANDDKKSRMSDD